MAVEVMMRPDVSVTKPEISIIIPLFDARIGEEDCVGSWVDQPDFAAEKYEILVISDGASENWRSVFAPCSGPAIVSSVTRPRRYWGFTTRARRRRAQTCYSSPNSIALPSPAA